MVPPSVYNWTYKEAICTLKNNLFKETAVIREVEGHVKPNTFFNTA